MIAVGNASLNAARRTRELDWLDTTGRVDVLVIGGGVTGTGVALDAAARGLTVALVEKHDLAFGTSRWSSKLVHGGLRYLASGHVGIAYESAVERGILMKTTAPHLVHPVPQVAPWFPQARLAQAAMLRGAFFGGDVLRTFARTSDDYLPHSRRVSSAEVLRYAPTVRPDGLRGGFLTWDGQLYDDARLVVAIARTAASYGARIITHCAAEQATGRGAVLVDQLSGRRLELDAGIVINATGIWADQVASGIKLRPSRGTHLVLPQSAFGGLSAVLTVPVPGELRRVVMAIPAPDGRVYVGLTDEEAPGPVSDVPLATEAEIDFLLSTISAAVRVPLTRVDLLGSYAGLRPLLDTGHHKGEDKTADISRRHAVITSPDGLVTIVGGKLTTYRRMAQDALDTALAQSSLEGRRPCLTHRIPLVGAADRVRLAAVRAPARFVARYGVEAADVIAVEPSLLEPVAPGLSTTHAELRFAVRHEGALTEDDLLDRRTRIGLSAVDRALALPAAREAFAAV
ncbi:glycerol-3-phosphate dehydrogenase/oxidase [Streptomyces sp. SID13031]|uniref:glycerol-3-phosphate dehydrogenase/oxidase n=1 Tax=Streptomyces sp. SID13031 TaxID=2706046 RepID=UPI0013C975BD|nr:glycerol-3-phosphate dehydrogenase/oxidase [Streptomyces sp. SID13031]NEA33324.1 glycerol-3-phosphate dehydrogenase/oxidase [Streptomyces sp. SID13031]